MKICIIQAGTSNFSGSFIRAHAELMKGDKVLIHGPTHDLQYNNRSIGLFYSKHPWLQKLKKLLPQWLYHKKVTLWQQSFNGKLDALAGFFKAHQVNVILAEFGFQGAAITPFAKSLEIPLVVHFHGHDAHRDPLLTDEVKSNYKAMFAYAYKIVSVSHFMTDKLLSLGCPEDKIVYNPYGPQAFFYEVQSSYGSTILNIGRFTDIKAPQLTLQAFKDAMPKCAEARLIMVGTGELLEACKSIAKAWHIEDRVTFTGGINHNQLMPYFNDACMFVQHSVQPSYGDAEGTPNTILEASAAALPVVSTRHAGIPQAVIHEQTGLLVDEYDVKAMSEAMVKLYNDKALCQQMGQAGRQHMQTNYNINRHISVLDDLIVSARKAH
ncbi:glycosyltransferase [Paucihalobacter ruber]|uniref:Glycosyltransferase n=1 Tax=Paucihalobacter ruber TaxID=2567861 RepID=A0A506PR70_9FLAO|nr:glycosyltransferase [Paucihalobacter ruber]TPV35752.1 glycosyltransferase [Paucihalobacter ruber]